MNFVQAVQTCLKKYVDFSGRAGRPEYWWFFLAQLVVSLIAGAVSDKLSGLILLALLLPGLGVTARRFHDIGKSGWFMLIGIIPLIGWLIVLYWMVQPSDDANKWGSGPYEPEQVALPPGAA